MRYIVTVLAPLTLALGIFATSGRASVFTVGGQQYTEATPTETLIATFTASDGGVSANSYSGLVKLTISDSGQARGTQFNDAFYLYTDSAGGPITPVPGVSDFYQIAIDNAPLGNNDTAWDAKHYIVYDVDAGTEVTSRPYVPAYRANHVYTFIIDTSLAPLGVAFPSPLHFGVSDGPPGGFSDNAGSFGVQVTQLSVVPEPTSLALLAAALFGVRRPRHR